MDIKRFDIVYIPKLRNILGRVESVEPFLVKTVHGVVTDLLPADVVRRGIRVCTLRGPQPWDPVKYAFERLKLAFPTWEITSFTANGSTLFTGRTGERYFEHQSSARYINAERIIEQWTKEHARI